MSNAGILESFDGGSHWIAHPPVSSWPAGTPGIDFLFDPALGRGDAKTWLCMTNGNGFWRTEDAGEHWVQVSTHDAPHGLGTVYRSGTGVLYAGAGNYPLRSTDDGKTWSQITDGLANAYYYAVHGDGSTLYTMKSLNFGSQPFPSYSLSPEDDGMKWTLQDSGKQTFSDGPIVMKYDADSHIMYSANWKAGIVALKVK
jgi:photosystem II stability/assembly factor-like uncharacterized protein